MFMFSQSNLWESSDDTKPSTLSNYKECTSCLAVGNPLIYSIILSFYHFIILSFYHSINQSIYLSINLLIYLSIYLSMYLFTYMSRLKTRHDFPITWLSYWRLEFSSFCRVSNPRFRCVSLLSVSFQPAMPRQQKPANLDAGAAKDLFICTYIRL